MNSSLPSASTASAIWAAPRSCCPSRIPAHKARPVGARSACLRDYRKFIRNFDPEKEICIVAERAGEIVGSIFIVKESEAVAKLRLLYLEPSARGQGLGRRLADEAIRFSRDKGYDRLELWTNSILTAARSIYENAGFELISEEPHHSFGHDLVGQYWALDLRQETA